MRPVTRIARTSRHGKIGATQQRTQFHALLPHQALEPVPLDADTDLKQRENEIAWCLILVNRILPLLLPPEDLANPCLDVLVSEIFSEMIVRNALCGKASEPWLLWEGITKVLRIARPGEQKLTPSALQTPRLEQYGLLGGASSPADSSRKSRSWWPFDGTLRLLLTIVQYAITTWTVLRACTVALMQASSLPTRASRPSYGLNTHGERIGASRSDKAHSTQRETSEHDMGRQPIICMHIWGCMSQLLSLNPRMPWLSGVLSLLQWIMLCGPGQIGSFDSRLDR